MPYDPQKHHRRSIRLKGYDYAQAGLYFITICCQNRACLFGAVSDGKMHLNDAGQMVETWYHELENKYPNIQCHEMVVMPNHFHCILEITDVPTIQDAHVGAPLVGAQNVDEQNAAGQNTGQPQGHARTVGDIIGEFKSITTVDYIHGVKNSGWVPFNCKLWQRNYYEHIIRNEKSFCTIAEYIVNNPARWTDDKFYTQ